MTTTEFLYWLLVQQSAWISGAISLYMTYQMGSKVWWAPFLGLLGQVFWALLAWFTNQPGLMVTVICYTIVHSRNALKWWREKRETEREAEISKAKAEATRLRTLFLESEIIHQRSAGYPGS